MLPALAGVALTWVTLVRGFPLGSDVNYGLSFFRGFSDQFLEGEIYPRWISYHYGGHGGPAFFFYPPLGFYFASILGAAFFIQSPFFVLAMASSAGLMLSGYACYAWLRSSMARHPAMAGALVYMMCPWHLILNYYLSASYASFMGYIFLPLIFLAFAELSLRQPRGIALAALAYAGLSMTHLPTLALLTPFLCLYILYRSCALRTNLRHRADYLAAAGIAGLAGLGLGAIYLVPALGMTDLLDQQWLWTGRFYYRTNFLCYFSCQTQLASINSLAVMTETAVCAGLLLFAYRRSREKEYLFWLFFTGALLFMTSPFSVFIWEHSYLPKVQNPLRYTVLMDAALAYAVAGAASCALNNKNEWRAGLVAILVLFVMTLLSVLDWHNKTYGGKQGEILKGRADYCIETGCAPREYIPATSKIRDEIAKPGPPYKILRGQGSVEVQRIYSRHWTIDVDARTPLTFRFRQHMYPGWMAKDGHGKIIPIKATGDNGEITFTLPKGKTVLDLRLEKNQYEIAGAVISAISLALIAAFLLTGSLATRWRLGLRRFRSR